MEPSNVLITPSKPILPRPLFPLDLLLFLETIQLKLNGMNLDKVHLWKFIVSLLRGTLTFFDLKLSDIKDVLPPTSKHLRA